MKYKLNSENRKLVIANAYLNNDQVLFSLIEKWKEEEEEEEE